MILIFLKLSKTLCIAAFSASFFSVEKELAILYGSIAIHEFAHFVACLVTKEKCLGITVNIFGMHLVCMPVKKLSHSLAILISGPATSFMMYLCVGFFIPKENFGFYLHFFSYINLSLTVANLIPIAPLDGGNIIKAIVQSGFGVIEGSKISQKTSRIFRVLIFILSALCVFCRLLNPSLIFFIVFLMCAEKRERELAMYDRKCILSGDTLCNKRLKYMAIDSECELSKIAEKISHSYYLIVAAFEKGKYVGDINETELIDAIKKKSYLCTIKEYLKTN